MIRSLTERGFSLIELSIALIIFGLLAGSLLGQTTGQRRLFTEQRARAQLDLSLEALYGFAISHGRLPCAADPTLDSSHAEAGKEDCTPNKAGVLPWRTLALPETDPWGQRLSYYAHGLFIAEPGGEARAGFSLTTKGGLNVLPGTHTTHTVANDLPAVIVSHGRNGLGGYRSNGQRSPASHPDEAKNADGSMGFINRPPDNQYDDLTVWIVPTVLNARMLAAGRLP
jgi:prepilin-type N-terminal cleavage/methylation domain-containing protein